MYEINFVFEQSNFYYLVCSDNGKKIYHLLLKKWYPLVEKVNEN
jgi:hypothetical protein